MKAVLIAITMLVAPAWAEGESIEACRADASSSACATYLNGVVESALMMGERQARATFGETFHERALSQRVGERIKQLGRSNCRYGRPDPVQLKSLLRDEFAAGKIDSTSDMYDILAAEMSCQRGPRSAGTSENVAP